MDAAERTSTRHSDTDYDGLISYSHAADDLLAEVSEQISRTFTLAECETYRIDSCPTE